MPVRLSAIGVLISIASVAVAIPTQAQTTNPISGHWRTADGAAVVEIKPCAQTLCGRLVWVREGADARDERNPDRSRRSAPICGLNVFSGFRSDEGGRWTGGSIYDPEAGRAISGVSLGARGDALTLTVGRGVFAGSETWRRAPAPSRPCQAR
ncbi:DUF2147 domain-containing protein [Sphingomonas ursincola]|uniref:DUF2147 domain-containing protein n=1 Tax=Sphingomonas ursincola TaxID=56361 RepID=A0A7V8RGL3_9SPHN|nr:DUF2147 domain-containing protein [Sphingomonas ursincola]MBA1375900.1 DUF2147 domain-containing protein [Sphingomonas ursincola]